MCISYGVRWLPTLQQQIRHFMKHRVLMDHNTFMHTARTYYGEDMRVRVCV